MSHKRYKVRVNLIEKQMIANGLTQSDLAGLVGCHKGTIGAILKADSRLPNAKTLKAICDNLGLRPEDVLVLEERMAGEEPVLAAKAGTDEI